MEQLLRELIKTWTFFAIVIVDGSCRLLFVYYSHYRRSWRDSRRLEFILEVPDYRWHKVSFSFVRITLKQEKISLRHWILRCHVENEKTTGRFINASFADFQVDRIVKCTQLYCKFYNRTPRLVNTPRTRQNWGSRRK